MNSVQIRLAFAGTMLANVEICFNDLKGFVAIINLDHPLLSFLRFAQSENCKSCSSEFQSIENTGEEDSISLDESKQIVCDQPLNEKRVIRLLNNGYDEEFTSLINLLEKGLNNNAPELCEEGVNGTYFMKEENGEIIAVFKPQDEEVISANNPKKGEDRDAKIESMQGILPGEAAQREVAAFLLDRDGFFGVPRTALVEVTHSSFQTENQCKIGSLQQFVQNNGASWDIGPRVFPVKEVHKIGVLDLYMLNFDRHGGNILYKNENGACKLIPIDNGFSLPDSFSISNLWFEWMNWSQSKQPFDAETCKYIEEMDPDRDIEMLKEELGFRSECLRVMKITSVLLKKAVAKGLTLYDLGRIVCPNPNEKSEIEKLCDTVMQRLNIKSFNAIEQEERFLEQLFIEMDKLIASKTKN